MELQIVKQNGEVDMVQLEQMLEAAASGIRRSLAIVDLDRGDVDGRTASCWSSKAESRNRKRKKGGEHGSFATVFDKARPRAEGLSCRFQHETLSPSASDYHGPCK